MHWFLHPSSHPSPTHLNYRVHTRFFPVTQPSTWCLLVIVPFIRIVIMHFSGKIVWFYYVIIPP